jgi:hypothetical protein
LIFRASPNRSLKSDLFAFSAIMLPLSGLGGKQSVDVAFFSAPETRFRLAKGKEMTVWPSQYAHACR